MSTRLAARFEALKKEGRAGLITFTMAYDPDLATSQNILEGLPAAGADIIEIGVPFSDPMADGKIIQAAGIRALKQGATLKRILGMVAEFRTRNTETPIVLMGYYNPVYRYGADAFATDAAKAGVDGVIIVDLPPEEELEITPSLKARGIDFVRLVTPTSGSERLPLLVGSASGFIYYVSITGITGTASANEAELQQRIAHIKTVTPLPVAIGFGVKTPEQVAALSGFADAVVVGSSIVNVVETHAGKPECAKEVLGFVKTLADATRIKSSARKVV